MPAQVSSVTAGAQYLLLLPCRCILQRQGLLLRCRFRYCSADNDAHDLQEGRPAYSWWL